MMSHRKYVITEKRDGRRCAEFTFLFAQPWQFLLGYEMRAPLGSGASGLVVAGHVSTQPHDKRAIKLIEYNVDEAVR